MKEWVNWSGSLRFNPARFVSIKSEQQLQEEVHHVYQAGGKLKVAAAGHSSSPLVRTDETLISLKPLDQLVSIGKEKMQVTLQSGMTVNGVNKKLQENKLALFNTGDVDVQTLAGAISTGTHGTGKRMQNLASVLTGVRMIDYKGDIHSFNEEEHPDILKAMRVSLGAFGIFSEITVRVEPLFQLRRIEICTDTETCLSHFDRLSDENRNVDFYWYPRSDEMKIRILNKPGEGSQRFDFKHRIKKVEQGLVGEILPRKRELKFEEIEYALDSKNAIACFREVRKRIKADFVRDVAWRVLVRTIAKDDAYVSPHNGRDSISISIHHNAGLPYDRFFREMELIFVEFGGRPHWAKKHWRTSEHLVALFPDWHKFQDIRRQLDPDGFFMNDHLTKLFV